jgi:hypothetical protein
LKSIIKQKKTDAEDPTPIRCKTTSPFNDRKGKTVEVFSRVRA